MKNFMEWLDEGLANWAAGSAPPSVHFPGRYGAYVEISTMINELRKRDYLVLKLDDPNLKTQLGQVASNLGYYLKPFPALPQQ
jgi:hypothetical protein